MSEVIDNVKNNDNPLLMLIKNQTTIYKEFDGENENGSGHKGTIRHYWS